ncbi:MAG: GNAT family N-acetyltransferase, partial [Eubacteriaceae bacterium]
MIRKAKHDDLDNIMHIIKDTIEEMQANGNDQWNEQYPERKDFDADIKMGELYVEEGNGQIMGFICVNYIEPDEYSGLNWSSNEKAMVIHRMSVNISSRTQGIGTNLMAFAEELAIENNVKYLKTDTYSLNQKMNRLLEKKGYRKVGEMSFHGK